MLILMFIVVIIINRIEIPNFERKIIIEEIFFCFFFVLFFFETEEATENGEDRLGLRVLNKGRASVRGEPFRLY